MLAIIVLIVLILFVFLEDLILLQKLLLFPLKIQLLYFLQMCW